MTTAQNAVLPPAQPTTLFARVRNALGLGARAEEEAPVVVPSVYESTLVLYNDADVDSMLATALMFYVPQFQNVSARTWHHLDFGVRNKTTGTVVNMGHEFDKDMLHDLIISTDLHLVLFMRRLSYEWLEDSVLYQNNRERFTLIKPTYDYVNELHRLTENTFTRMLHYFLLERKMIVDIDKDLPLELTCAIPYVLRFTTFAYPVAEFEVDVGAPYPVETENGFRIMIRDLTSKLVHALGEPDQKVQLDNLRVGHSSDPKTYLNYNIWHRRVSAQLGRAMNDQVLKIEKGMKTTKWKLRVVALSEHDIHQLGMVPLINNHAIVAYEDIRGYRFYRIYAPDINTARSIAEAFKPREIYVEGVFVTAICHVPKVF